MNQFKPIKALVILLCILFSHKCFSQLPAFTLTITPTAQTCLGNGSLNFSVQGNNASATIAYQVYLLPNTTTPLTVVNTASVGGLTAGDYLVIATQSLGGQSNTATATATIGNNVTPLTYTLQGQNVRCGNDGVITVNVLTGNAASYEIMAGPVTVAPQSSNVFNNLPVGTYQVRVFDNCGEAVVVTLQLLQQSTNIIILAGQVQSTELPSCDEIVVTNDFYCASNQDIFYPLTLQYTVYPPGGGTPDIVTQTIANGGDNNTAVATIPFYHAQQYTYRLRITDACGNVYTRNNNIVNREFIIAASTSVDNCEDYMLDIELFTFVGPVTVTFTDAPDDFDPYEFNAAHPVFDTQQFSYGQTGNYVPEGDYSISITDACGRTATLDYEVAPPPLEPQVTAQVQNCSDTGSLTIKIPGREIVQVTLEEATEDYLGTVPDDVSVNITDGEFNWGGLPIGEYLFTVIDACGEEHEAEASVFPVGVEFAAVQRPGCEEGQGSLALTSDTTDMQTISITDAPDEYTEELPFNVSANIATNGNFYINSLPEGDYTFTFTDGCGALTNQDVSVEGYHADINEMELIPHCGSFDLYLHSVNNGYLSTFWLQQYNEATGQWENPETGVPYAENTQPNNGNSILLLNNSTTINLAYTGDFRIVQSLFVYTNGTSSSQNCVQVVHEFTFSGGPVITDAYSFPCNGGLTEVAIVAEGVPPLTYKITQKNGQDFVIDNGESNLFSGLEPANYNFQVTDVCGNIRNIQFDINELDPLVIEATGFCEGEESMLSVLDFGFITYEWYKEGMPGTILSTTSTLNFQAYNSATDTGTYYVNLIASDPSSCLNQTLEYTLAPNDFPDAGNSNMVAICNTGDNINLADYITGDAGGTWEDISNTASLNNSILSTDGLAAGSYEFKYTVNGDCGLTDEVIVTITLKAVPQAPVPDAVAPVCEGDVLQLSVADVPGATYSWSGPAGFSSTEQNPVISAALPVMSGDYFVTVTVDGCISNAASTTILINEIPDYTLEGNTILCDGQSTVVSVVPGNNFIPGNVNYTWFKDAAEINGINASAIEIFETGVYTVIVNNNGCTAEREITISENTNPFTVLPYGGCIDEEYTLWVANAAEINALQYEWTGPNGYSYLGEQANISGQQPGVYTVTVTNAEGCTETATVIVDNINCKIPKGISPNGDNMNDTFDLANLDVREITIFNRYGLEVYHSKNYTNQWYGQSDKGDLPTATYFYVLQVGSGKKLTGWVYLLKEL